METPKEQNSYSNTARPMPINQHTDNTLALAVTSSEKQEVSIRSYITVDEYNPSDIVMMPIDVKVVPGSNPPQNYYLIPLGYNMGTKERPNAVEFQMECCEMVSSRGIQDGEPPGGGRKTHSIMCRFDNSNIEHMKFVEVMEDLHKISANIFYENRFTHKKPLRNIGDAFSILKRPIYRQIDLETGEPFAGRAPFMSIKLLHDQALFTGLDGAPIPWTLLRNVDIKFIPLIRISRLYFGAQCVIQIDMISAVVTSVIARNTTTQQISTINRLLNARPDLQNTVAAQIAKLVSDRQEQLSPYYEEKPKGAKQEHQEANPTFTVARTIFGMLGTIILFIAFTSYNDDIVETEPKTSSYIINLRVMDF